jgi:hypothetical protein
METTKPKLTRVEIDYNNRRMAIAATQVGDLQTLSALVHTRAQANWLSPDRRGWSLLSMAVLFGQTAIVKWLLEQGANPNTLFFEDRLIAFPSDNKYAEGAYNSPLVIAIDSQDVEVIALLLEHGASVDLPVFLHHTFEMCCREVLFSSGLEGPVKARREAIQIAKSVGATATQNTAGKARL